MALKKDIILENGVIMTYHRIAEIQNTVNFNTTLVIYSYINQEQRNKEKKLQISPSRVLSSLYRITDYVNLEYNDNLSITEAYEYLKTTDKYSGAEDIFENN